MTRLRENTLLFSFTDDHSKAPELILQKRVWALAAWLEERRESLGLLEIVPGMGNLLLSTAVQSVGACSTRDSAGIFDLDSLSDQILILWPTLASTDIKGRTIEIPVIYGGDAGPDLKEVAAHTGLSPDDIIARHCAGEYRVYCLGFQPGFAYLGGLDAALATPRRATPRLVIPAGSVAIGGSQTAVYPSTTPGGWQIIGHSVLKMFDPEQVQPSLLMPGDLVRFINMGGS